MAKRSKHISDFPSSANVIRHQCPWCGEFFFGRRNAVYCSDTCRVYYNKSLRDEDFHELTRTHHVLPRSPVWLLREYEIMQRSLIERMRNIDPDFIEMVRKCDENIYQSYELYPLNALEKVVEDMGIALYSIDRSALEQEIKAVLQYVEGNALRYLD